MKTLLALTIKYCYAEYHNAERHIFIEKLCPYDECPYACATTIRKMTLDIMTFSIKSLFATLRITVLIATMLSLSFNLMLC
jgi:hypothetical protein